MTDELETVFLSKYLAKKPKELRVDRALTFDNGTVGVWPVDGYAFWILGRDCHATREAAVEDLKRRRDAKIASLEKQIEKLRAMVIE